MKRSLHIKMWILLGYVLACTAAVLIEWPETAPESRRGGAEQLNN